MFARVRGSTGRRRMLTPDLSRTRPIYMGGGPPEVMNPLISRDTPRSRIKRGFINQFIIRIVSVISGTEEFEHPSRVESASTQRI